MQASAVQIWVLTCTVQFGIFHSLPIFSTHPARLHEYALADAYVTLDGAAHVVYRGSRLCQHEANSLIYRQFKPKRLASSPSREHPQICNGSDLKAGADLPGVLPARLQTMAYYILFFLTFTVIIGGTGKREGSR